MKNASVVMSKYTYCPICGLECNQKECIYCEEKVPLQESKYDSEYYEKKAEDRGMYDFLYYKVIFQDEIVNNPLFNQEAHERAKKMSDEHFKKISYDPLKYNEEYQRMPKCPSCQSTHIKQISLLNRYVHYKAIGFLSKTARSEWVCRDCGYKW